MAIKILSIIIVIVSMLLIVVIISFFVYFCIINKIIQESNQQNPVLVNDIILNKDSAEIFFSRNVQNLNMKNFMVDKKKVTTFKKTHKKAGTSEKFKISNKNAKELVHNYKSEQIITPLQKNIEKLDSSFQNQNLENKNIKSNAFKLFEGENKLAKAKIKDNLSLFLDENNKESAAVNIEYNIFCLSLNVFLILLHPFYSLNQIKINNSEIQEIFQSFSINENEKIYTITQTREIYEYLTKNKKKTIQALTLESKFRYFFYELSREVMTTNDSIIDCKINNLMYYEKNTKNAEIININVDSIIDDTIFIIKNSCFYIKKELEFVKFALNYYWLTPLIIFINLKSISNKQINDIKELNIIYLIEGLQYFLNLFIILNVKQNFLCVFSNDFIDSILNHSLSDKDISDFYEKINDKNNEILVCMKKELKNDIL